MKHCPKECLEYEDSLWIFGGYLDGYLDGYLEGYLDGYLTECRDYLFTQTIPDGIVDF